MENLRPTKHWKNEIDEVFEWHLTEEIDSSAKL